MIHDHLIMLANNCRQQVAQMAEDLPVRFAAAARRCACNGPCRLCHVARCLVAETLCACLTLHALIEVAKCRLMLCCCVVYALQVVWDGVRAQDGR